MTTTNDSHLEHSRLVQEYFDTHAQSWHDYYQANNSLTHIILKKRMRIGLEFMRQHLPPEKGYKILDAGCGSGLIAVELARQGYVVEAWDISEKMISLSQMNFKAAQIPDDQYTLTTGNLLESTLESGSFNGIMALGFLQYQPDETAVLKYFYNLLQPGGILVISGPVGNRLSNYFGLSAKIQKVRRRGKKKKTKMTAKAADRKRLHTISANSYSTKRFKTLLETAGFQMLAYQGHGYAHFDFLSRRLPNRHQKRLHRLLTRLSKVLPIQRYANDLDVVAKR